MGNCRVKRAQKASKNYSSSVKIIVPDLCYISRRNKSLLLVESQESTEISLQKKIKLFRDSSISALPDSSLIIAGGSDSSSCLTSRVYQVFPFKKLIRKLPSLPIPCKFGKFHLYNSSLIYLAGICEAQDNDSSQSEQGSPIFQLKMEEKKWTVYTDENTFNPSKYLERNIISGQDKARLSAFKKIGLFLKDLIEPASVLVGSKIYLIGGRISQEENSTVTDKIFTASIEDGFRIVEERLRLPVPLQAGSCESTGKVIIIAGGLLADFSENFEVFVIHIESETVSKLSLRVDRPVELRYPIFIKDRGVLCFSPPKMMYLREDKKKIFTFSLPTQVKKSEISVEVDFLTADIEKSLVDLKINQISEDFYVEPQEFELNVQKGKVEDQNREDEEIEIECDLEIIDESKKDIISLGCFICRNFMKENFISYCDYCKSKTQPIYSCSFCSHAYCSSCLSFLQLYSKNSLSLTCTKSHVLLIDPKKSENPCLNCLHPKKPHLFCFICNDHLCLACYKDLESLAKLGNLCPLLHSLSYSLSSSQICSICLHPPSQLYSFKCETCSYSVCLTCISSQKTNPEKSKNSKENPSTIFNIKEPSLQNDSSEPVLVKELSPFTDLDNRLIPEDSEPTIKPIQFFATPLEEIRRKIPQKPIRGEKSPIILSLSPTKDENFIKKKEAKPIPSPKEATIPRISIGVISADRMSKYTSNYFFPKPLNNEYRSVNASDPSFKRQIDEIKKFLNRNQLEDLHSARVGMQSETNNYSEVDISYRSQKKNPFLGRDDSLDKYEGNRKDTLESIQRNNAKIVENSEKKKEKEICEKSSEKSSSKNKGKIGNFEGNKTENKDLFEANKETEKSIEEIVMNNNSRFSLNHESFSKDISASVRMDTEEQNEGAFNETSNYFSTLGDDSEQIAPVIEKDLANDKLTALKAKLNLLTDRSSSESESESFKGFVIGNFPMSMSNGFTEESKISYTQKSIQKGIEKIEDSRGFILEKSLEKNGEVQKIFSNQSSHKNKSGSSLESSNSNCLESESGQSYSESDQESSEESGSFYGFMPINLE